MYSRAYAGRGVAVCAHHSAQAALRDKSKQLKVMGAEVSMHAAKCDALRVEMERMGREMEALKAQHWARKDKGQ